MVTPFLKPFNAEGGTLYTFPSVSKDLTRTFVSNDYEFKFSYFACLNLPDIMSGTFADGCDKGLYLETFGKDVEWTSDGMGNALVEHLQNYVMNFETAILNGEGDNDDYDNDILSSVSEKVFFNWLQKVGGIKFAGNTEDYSKLVDRTVQYIGKIDMMNTVEIGGDSFEEVYLSIPSTSGASPSVLFRDGSATDNKNYINKDYLLSSGETIIGRNGVDHVYGLSTDAIFDDDTENKYVGDSGHTIDFRDSVYSGGINNANANSTSDFEFNAILIYYDLYKKTKSVNRKLVSTNLYGILFLNTPTDLASGTNSTDNTNAAAVQGCFERYPKIKETSSGNGNSFGIKLDFKIDTIPDDNGQYDTTVKLYDPNSVVSMALYERALVQLQKSVDFFYTQKNYIYQLEQRISELETLVMGIDTIEALNGRIDRLYNLYDGTDTTNTSALQDLIEENSKKLNSIMNGETNLKLQYDTDVIQGGHGITIDKSQNKVVINSNNQYTVNDVYTDETMTGSVLKTSPIYSVSSDSTKKTCYIKLKPGDNFAPIYIFDNGEFDRDLTITIDDSDCEWSVGQSFRICFVCDSNNSNGLRFRSGHGIIIQTCNTDGYYYQNICKDGTNMIDGSEIEGNNIIEIICVGNDTLQTNIKEFIHLIK